MKDNPFYIDNKKYGSFYDIENFILCTMILYDENPTFESFLHFVKKIKESTGLGLYYIKGYSDLIRDLGFIQIDNHNNFIIKNGILNIKSYKDIINMIDKNMNYEQFMRLHKIRKIKTNIIN